MQQPLLQFLLLGSLVFGLERWLAGAEDDPRRIVIDDQRYAEIAGIYKDNQGHSPSDAQMADLTIKWAQNELLYREARLMGLDDGDEMIRQRLILKLRNVLFNRVNDAEISDAELRDWFVANRTRYDDAPAYVVEQFLLEAGQEESAESLRTQLLAGEAVPDAYAEQLRAYGARTADNLAYMFKADSVERLLDAPLSEWQVVESAVGTHLARVTEQVPGAAAEFDAIKREVRADWEHEQQQRQLREALTNVAGSYEIRIELTSPPDDWDEERIEAVRLAMRSLP